MKVQVRIPAPLAREYHQEVIKNLYWVDSRIAGASYLKDSEDVLEVDYSAVAMREDVRDKIAKTALGIIQSISRMQVRTVYDQTDLPVSFQDDPMPELESRGWARPLFPGGYAYSGPVLKLMNGLDREFRRYALSLACEEHYFPTSLDYEGARRSGYLKSYPQHVNIICHIHEDLDALRSFKEQISGASTGDAARVLAHLATPETILSPTICHHFWHGLADGVYSLDDLLVGTAVGACHRHEGRATSGMERLREFRMREVFAIGRPDQVIAFRQKLLDDQIAFLQKFRIAGRIESATDPFFVDDYSTKRMYQVALDLKHEVKAVLPYMGSLLAIGSANYHQNYFSNSFNISAQSGGEVHSCCLGFGLDRWCLAVFAQHGLDADRWPEPLREVILE